MLEVRGLDKSFGGVHATFRVTLDVQAGEIHAVIGPNGAGKTTLVSQLAGEVAPDAGEILLDGTEITRLPFAASGAEEELVERLKSLGYIEDD